MSKATDDVLDVARELRLCGLSWVPEARVLGNVRAADIVRVCDALLSLRAAGTGEGEKGPIVGYRIKWDDAYDAGGWSTTIAGSATKYATREHALARLATLNEGWRDNARIVPVRRRGGKR